MRANLLDDLVKAGYLLIWTAAEAATLMIASSIPFLRLLGVEILRRFKARTVSKKESKANHSLGSAMNNSNSDATQDDWAEQPASPLVGTSSRVWSEQRHDWRLGDRITVLENVVVDVQRNVDKTMASDETERATISSPPTAAERREKW